MKAFTLLGRSFVNFLRKSGGNSFQELYIFRSFRFNKERHFLKIDFTLFAECLHRIKYSIPFCIPFPNTHRDTSRGMHQQRILFSFCYLRQQIY